MKEKREVPVWALVSTVVVLVGFVAFMFIKGASGGDASKATLDEIRGNQRKFSTMDPMKSPNAPTSAQR